ncbi:MAG TPA: hypothetical protein EYG68_06885 [Leucothrix mucor]|nr:hypothetical protein [Leucothrix mucor]
MADTYFLKRKTGAGLTKPGFMMGNLSRLTRFSLPIGAGLQILGSHFKPLKRLGEKLTTKLEPIGLAVAGAADTAAVAERPAPAITKDVASVTALRLYGLDMILLPCLLGL